MRKRLKTWRRWLPAALYLAYALAWLGTGLLGLAFNRAATPALLQASAAVPEGLAPGSGVLYVSQNGDPKLVFEGIGRRVRHVRLAAGFSSPPGEMDLYYTQKPGQGFSVRRRAVGAPQADGSYLYTLPPFTTVQDLRIDLGTLPENGINITAIELDPRLPAGHFLTPTLRTAVGVAALPALALCTIYTIIEWYQAAKKWRAGRRARPAGRPSVHSR